MADRMADRMPITASTKGLPFLYPFIFDAIPKTTRQGL